MKKLLALFLAVAMAVGLCSCYDPDSPKDDSKRIMNNKAMKIGYTEYAPFTYHDEDGNLTGFDVDLAKAVCEKLRLEPEFKEISWESKEWSLDKGEIDVLWSGVPVNDERKENMDFSDPYLTRKQCLVTLTEKAFEYTEMYTLAGVKVAAVKDTWGEYLVNNYLDYPVAAIFDTPAEVFSAVYSGDAAVAVVDLTLAENITGSGTEFDTLAVSIALELPPQNYAAAFRKGSSAADSVSTALKSLRQDGTIEKLAEKYGLESFVID